MFKLEVLAYHFFLVVCVLFNSLTVPGSESKLLNSYRAEPRGGGGGWYYGFQVTGMIQG